MSKVIVVGGGLAGLSATHTILERGGSVLLLDKNPFLGGNSTKATSGINGALTRVQIKQGVKDSVEAFERDTALSATKGKTDQIYPLGKVLVGESAPAIEWLINRFNLDLSLLGQLGGHSYFRTHRGKEKFPGMTITYALMKELEAIAKERPNVAEVRNKCRVEKLLIENGEVVGVTYKNLKTGEYVDEYGVVVISTGGYGADFAEDSLLMKVRPDLKTFSTTNGEHCTGDGIKMAIAVGANTKDITWVQVHPTGLVHPKDPNAKVKFLAAEALRGTGGLLLTGDGKRFVNELGRRDYVTGEMQKNKGPFTLLLNSKCAKEIEWHCRHYTGRGLMTHLKGGDALAKHMGVSTSALKSTFERYNNCIKQGKDEYGKPFMRNGPWTLNDEFYAAIVTPVVHYTMGGININPLAEVLKPNGENIPGLFAAGEVCGGVHGLNRLGGSALLDGVVYGRVSGGSAAKYLLEKCIKNYGKQVDVKSSNAPQVVRESSSSESGDGKKQKSYTMEEVAKHNTEDDCWVVVNDVVLDVTSFLDDHPGGKQAIMLYAGKDATEEFNMLHEEDVVEKYAPECILGPLQKGGNLKSRM